jgi:predicted RNA-binding protein
MELDETYPLAQHEVPRTVDLESKRLISRTIKTYVASHKYSAMILHVDHRVIGEQAAKRIASSCEEVGIKVMVTPKERVDPKSKQSIEEFQKALIEVHKVISGT